MEQRIHVESLVGDEIRQTADDEFDVALAQGAEQDMGRSEAEDDRRLQRNARHAGRRAPGRGPLARLDRRRQRASLIAYTITAKDVAGPFIAHVPDDYREKAALDRLAYTSAQELLAEKFHMSEPPLRRLNPDAAFGREGSEVVVANVNRSELPRKLARIGVDGARRRVLAFDEAGRIVAAYPATVGSRERRSPSGEFKVTAIAENPPYRYDPSLNLRGVKVEEPLDIPPGPNNPVGAVWIALSAKGYGIHGTSEPEAVGKQASHGCVRLTNWDALELAKHVRKRTPVVFQRNGSRPNSAACALLLQEARRQLQRY